MKISIQSLEELILASLNNKYSADEAQRICDVILFGELSGKTTHGIVRLLIGNSSVLALSPNGKPRFQKKTPLSTLIQGNGNPGVLVASLAMDEVIRLTKEHGIGIVGTNDTRSSSGSLSYYAENITHNNLVGIIMAQSPPSTPPFGGIEPLFGTNPIAFGIPADPRPIIFDMATAAITFGAILKAATLGQKLPEGVAIDSAGNPTTDPKAAMDGATRPFDNSYKGAGLAMMVEILSGMLPGADFAGLHPQGGWGNLFLAFSPQLLGDVQTFKHNMSKLIDKIRNSKTKDKMKIRIAGENALATRDRNLKIGTVDVEEQLLNKLKQIVLH